ncbi:MAG: DUF177 domain-containing protein [Lachnospiraceae bacterium]|nr:DUF177 domain-containing protein [Lachnospiraceae bacterium]
MLMNLTDVFTSEGKVKKTSQTYDAGSVSYMGESYPVVDKSDVSLTFTNIGTGRILLEGEMSLTVDIPCDRCLQSVKVPIGVSFAHEIAAPNEEGVPSEEEEQCFMSGYELDTDTLINNEILINMPVKVLCKEECKGICPVCGQNLNEKECGCDTFVPDPRMAAIKDIFNANKEV